MKFPFVKHKSSTFQQYDSNRVHGNFHFLVLPLSFIKIRVEIRIRLNTYHVGGSQDLAFCLSSLCLADLIADRSGLLGIMFRGAVVVVLFEVR